jgi:hypothetical protein
MTPHAEPRVVEATITARPYGGTYIARVSGFNMTASCTMGADQAAEAVARKFAASRFEKNVFVLERIGSRVWKITVTEDRS